MFCCCGKCDGCSRGQLNSLVGANTINGLYGGVIGTHVLTLDTTNYGFPKCLYRWTANPANINGAWKHVHDRCCQWSASLAPRVPYDYRSGYYGFKQWVRVQLSNIVLDATISRATIPLECEGGDPTGCQYLITMSAEFDYAVTIHTWGFGRPFVIPQETPETECLTPPSSPASGPTGTVSTGSARLSRAEFLDVLPAWLVPGSPPSTPESIQTPLSVACCDAWPLFTGFSPDRPCHGDGQLTISVSVESCPTPPPDPPICFQGGSGLEVYESYIVNCNSYPQDLLVGDFKWSLYF
jgi:hypothetical protein